MDQERLKATYENISEMYQSNPDPAVNMRSKRENFNSLLTLLYALSFLGWIDLDSWLISRYDAFTVNDFQNKTSPLLLAIWLKCCFSIQVAVGEQANLKCTSSTFFWLFWVWC